VPGSLEAEGNPGMVETDLLISMNLR